VIPTTALTADFQGLLYSPRKQVKKQRTLIRAGENSYFAGSFSRVDAPSRSAGLIGRNHADGSPGFFLNFLFVLSAASPVGTNESLFDTLFQFLVIPRLVGMFFAKLLRTAVQRLLDISEQLLQMFG